MTPEQLEAASEDIIRYMNDKHPMEIYETGALLLSVGSFLICSAIPDLWPQLKSTALLAHQLLDQDNMKKINPTPESKIITL